MDGEGGEGGESQRVSEKWWRRTEERQREKHCVKDNSG